MGGHLLRGDVGGDGYLLRAGRDLQQVGQYRMQSSAAQSLASAPSVPSAPRTSSGNSSPTSDRIREVFPTWAARGEGTVVRSTAEVTATPPVFPWPLRTYPRPAVGCAHRAAWLLPAAAPRTHPSRPGTDQADPIPTPTLSFNPRRAPHFLSSVPPSSKLPVPPTQHQLVIELRSRDWQLRAPDAAGGANNSLSLNKLLRWTGQWRASLVNGVDCG